jgi:hypothetical protein
METERNIWKHSLHEWPEQPNLCQLIVASEPNTNKLDLQLTQRLTSITIVPIKTTRWKQPKTTKTNDGLKQRWEGGGTHLLSHKNYLERVSTNNMWKKGHSIGIFDGKNYITTTKHLTTNLLVLNLRKSLQKKTNKSFHVKWIRKA